MKTLITLFIVSLFSYSSNAQVTGATLQASGLTCSMCSKAVKEALEEVAFVEKVTVNIKKQEYNLHFRSDAKPDFDGLLKAVEDAGFSIAALHVNVNTEALQVEKDGHYLIAGYQFHFLNDPGKKLEGLTSLKIVDKGFLPEKEHKQWIKSSQHPCVNTGKTAACCIGELKSAEPESRIYHVVI